MVPLRSLAALALVSLTPFLLPGAPAHADACATPATPSLPPAGAPWTVHGSLAFADVAPCGPGFLNTSDACGPGPSVQPGEFCGLAYPAGAVVRCSWLPVGVGKTVGLLVGIDTTGDGGISVQDPPMFLAPPDGLAGQAVASFQLTVPSAGQLIAFPLSAVQGGSPGDVTQVLCA